MLLCDNYNGGYHLFYLKPQLTQVLVDIWYNSSCSPSAPWFLLKPCHAFPDSGLGGDTWEFHLSFLLCIVYICAYIFFWLISFYLWSILIFLFNRVYYGFTPLWNRTSWHYTSQRMLPNKLFFGESENDENEGDKRVLKHNKLNENKDDVEMKKN